MTARGSAVSKTRSPMATAGPQVRTILSAGEYAREVEPETVDAEVSTQYSRQWTMKTADHGWLQFTVLPQPVKSGSARGQSHRGGKDFVRKPTEIDTGPIVAALRRVVEYDVE